MKQKPWACVRSTTMLLLTILSGIKRTVVSRVRTGLVGVSVCVRDVGGNSYSNKRTPWGLTQP